MTFIDSLFAGLWFAACIAWVALTIGAGWKGMVLGFKMIFVATVLWVVFVLPG